MEFSSKTWHKATAIVLLSVAITTVFALYSKESSLSFAKIESAWLDYHKNSAVNNETLIHLLANTGYGGFFYNYQLLSSSRDSEILPKLSQQASELKASINAYRKTDISAEERSVLDRLEKSVNYLESQAHLSFQLNTPLPPIKEIENLDTLSLLISSTQLRNQTGQNQASNALNQAMNIMFWGNLLIPAVIILGSAYITFMIRVLAAKKRAETNRRNLLSLIAASPDAMLTLSQQGIISQCNHQAEKLFCAPRERLIGHSVHGFIDLDLQLTDYINETQDLPHELCECFALVSSQQMIPVEIAISHVQLDNESTLIITFRDISIRKSIEFTLMHNESRLRSILESVGEGVIGVNKTGSCTFINPAAIKLLGLSPNTELVGTNLHTILHHSQDTDLLYDQNMSALNNAILEGQPFYSDHEILRNTHGHTFDAELRSYPLFEDDQVTGAVITFCDISERKQHEERLSQAAIVFNGTKDGIIISDNQAKIIAVNQAFTDLSGYTEQEALGKEIHFHKYEDSHSNPQKKINVSLTKLEHWQGETWNRRKNNEIYPVWEDISCVKNTQGKITHYISVFSDISVIKESEQRLNHLAHHDILTGLPNRLLFSVNLTQTLERAKRHKYRVGLLFIDLDRFKLINDTLGHACGDQLLEIIASRLKNSVRAEDTVARLSGDEFTVILSQINHPEDIVSLAEKINYALAECVLINNQEVVVSASVGISIYPDDATNGEDLAKAADTAMYRAKEKGRNTYQFYSSDMTARAKEHLDLEQGLRQAILKEEFVLYYQPQYCLKNQHISGVEALIRWQHPKLGLISPKKFIGIAEETGLIESITEWVLETACQQIKNWRHQGLPPFRVSVNISGREIIRSESLSKLKSIIEHAHIESNELHLELEITEGVLQNVNHGATLLKELKALGVSIAIDDFGTGYSSLSRLKHLPIDTLKIDRSFVKDLPNNQDDGAIASAVIAMGRSLNLRVIAEGTETKEQIHFLRDQGCDEVQGFLLSEPVAAHQIPRIIMDNSTQLTRH